MSVRKIKLKTSLQRPFALNLTRAYRTTATSSATVLAGLIPLHIIVEMEAVYTKVIHLRKDASLSNTTYCLIQYETLGHPLHTHPAVKGKDVKIDLSRHSNANETQVPTQGSHFYSDGSKQEDGVGCAYVYYQDGQRRREWKGRLQLQNSVFQAEVLAITAATQHIIHQDITHATLHTDSFSTLQALLNHQHTSPLIISLQHLLQRYAHINLLLKWIKAHADNEGNENADRLAKQAVTDSDAQFNSLPAPPSHLKSILRKQCLQLWQREWNLSPTGRRTFDFIPKVSTERHFAIAPLTQFITGNGPFPQLLLSTQHISN
ncbi:uncharacterized protein LOC118202310 [Stegodyphus dumicola]|uniref:uncharacterized protein LOC118202310 n=1 Tax=Stegodyphus dumicola TaxID=202533 RepID=UPI0015A9645D|nr:uncharacterized protein LOC118202310 [Stegodyphus dumicola]